jgi:hypothetical protein
VAAVVVVVAEAEGTEGFVNVGVVEAGGEGIK